MNLRQCSSEGCQEGIENMNSVNIPILAKEHLLLTLNQLI